MKKILVIIMAISITFTLVLPVYGTNANPGAGKFSDVPDGYWASGAIQWMVENGIIEGDGGGQFFPSREVSRDEYAKMMVLTLNLKLINPPEESFLDIKKGGWQFKYAETAKPYMTGFRTSSGDYFHPSQPAVREDMAVALVKALGFDNETADMSILSQFADEAVISPNLKKFVAIAVKHQLMEGYDKDGKRVFAPDEGLNRASAATLLHNAFKENEEKITYEDEKVTYEGDDSDDGEVNNDDENENEDGDDEEENGEGDGEEDENEDENENENSGLASSNIRVKISGDKAVISWKKINSSGFNGYKVVISESDPTPVYPDNGYLAYITDRNNTSITVKAGDGYNGGDFGGRLKSGHTYYFSITVLYDNGKAPGNTVSAKLP